MSDRRVLISIVLAMAVVAIVIPTCRMVGCSMEMDYMGFMHAGDDFGFFGYCGGEYTTSAGPEGIVPANGGSLFTLLAGFLAAIAAPLIAAVRESRPVLLIEATPPPPPEEPRGERFRV